MYKKNESITNATSDLGSQIRYQRQLHHLKLLPFKIWKDLYQKHQYKQDDQDDINNIST